MALRLLVGGLLARVAGGANPLCEEWARAGECTANPGFMLAECASACQAARDSNANCSQWAALGECVANPAFMHAACPLACGSTARVDTHEECATWASKGECEKNAGFMLSGCAASCHRRAEARRDKQPECAEYGRRGDCDARWAWMQQHCWATCDRLLADQRDAAECAALAEGGACGTAEGVGACRGTCMAREQARRSADTEGNCWYWATDGECEGEGQVLKQCPQSCRKLHECTAAPESDGCALPFECPLEKDERPDCTRRALAGECRAPSRWRASALLKSCSTSCHLLDPPSVSHAVTRPKVGRSRLVDAASLFSAASRHGVGRCPWGAQRLHALLDGRCPNRRLAWIRSVSCAPSTQSMSPRLPPPEPAAPLLAGSAIARSAAWDISRVRVRTIYGSPRVRLIDNFVTEEEAQRLIELAKPRFRRSGTARAAASDYRTSESAMLPSDDETVMALRLRMAHFVGYPEQNLEPLQGLRYQPGQFYKPHHDFYNACETWLDGNRHFTFLVYLNHVEGGGQTRLPRLNLTVDTTAYAALLFNNCLDNGEPDERTLHEGLPPVGTKYAINGWMRSKHLAVAPYP